MIYIPLCRKFLSLARQCRLPSRTGWSSQQWYCQPMQDMYTLLFPALLNEASQPPLPTTQEFSLDQDFCVPLYCKVWSSADRRAKQKAERRTMRRAILYAQHTTELITGFPDWLERRVHEINGNIPSLHSDSHFQHLKNFFYENQLTEAAKQKYLANLDVALTKGADFWSESS